MAEEVVVVKCEPDWHPEEEDDDDDDDDDDEDDEIPPLLRGCVAEAVKACSVRPEGRELVSSSQNLRMFEKRFPLPEITVGFTQPTTDEQELRTSVAYPPSKNTILKSGNDESKKVMPETNTASSHTVEVPASVTADMVPKKNHEGGTRKRGRPPKEGGRKKPVPANPPKKRPKGRTLSVCAVCGKAFSRRSSLNQHMLVHTGERPWPCSICQKTFTNKSNLKQHMIMHSGVKAHICPECNKAFTIRSHLVRHRNVHTGAKPYSCPECFRVFSQTSSLRQHMLGHAGVRPHACPICGKAFSQRSTLKQHIFVHTGEKPHGCPQCSKGFAQKSNLTHHILVHHTSHAILELSKEAISQDNQDKENNKDPQDSVGNQNKENNDSHDTVDDDDDDSRCSLEEDSKDGLEDYHNNSKSTTKVDSQ